METKPQLCPLCGAPTNVGTARCRCTASSATQAAPTNTNELVAQADALYASYLAARIVRARRAIKTAKIELLRDPRNRHKAQALKVAEENGAILKNKLLAHTRAHTLATSTQDTSTIEAAQAAIEKFRAAQTQRAKTLVSDSPSAVPHTPSAPPIDVPHDSKWK